MEPYSTLYRALLVLYPASYRQEYEQEMVLLFEDMLSETVGQRERLALLASSAFETVRWSAPELVTETEANVLSAPTFIKAASSLSVLCVVPFLLVFMYHLHLVYDHDAKPVLVGLLSDTAFVYQAILPAIALSIAVGTAVWSLVNAERYWQVSWAARLRTAWHNSLLVLGFVSFLALAMLT